MKRCLAVVCLFLATSAFAQTRRRAVASGPVSMPQSAETTPVRGVWSVEITTTGGFGGAGSGDLRVDSTGKLVVGQFVALGRQCEFILTPADTAAIEAAVLAARADLWFASYVPASELTHCCDLIFQKMRVQRLERFAFDGQVRNVPYSTEFLSTGLPGFPSDLSGLWNLLYAGHDSVFARYDPTCR